MDLMIGIIGWVLFVIASMVAGALFAGQAAPRKALAEAEAKLRASEIALEAAQKEPVAASVTANGAPAPPPTSPGVQKKLAANEAEIKRLKDAVENAERQVRLASEKVIAADARIAAAESRVASGDAMIAQARSKAAEAGHAAVQEAKRETEQLRAALAEAEARAAEVSLGGAKISELARAAERADALQTELAQAEARTADAVATAERTSRERFEAQLIAAKQNFAAEKEQLLAQIETARTPAPADSLTEATMPVRPRKQPTPTKSVEIGADTEKPLVILADTDTKSADALSKHLEAAGYGVRAVRTVADALQIARTASPAALALDGTNLPDGDCWQMLSQVKEDADLKEIPVLVFAPGKDKEKAMEMGAAGCFTKPIDKAVLVSTIKAAMVKRKQRARLAAASGGASGSVSGTARRSSLLTTPSS